MTGSTPSFNPLDNALREAAIRLAWYIGKYGSIPSSELVGLKLFAMGLRSDDSAKKLLADAREVRAYLLEICKDCSD